MKYSFDPDAQAEYLEAIQYYEQQFSGLGAQFIADVEQSIGRMLAFPETWGRLTFNTRRTILEVFPYGIIYYFDGTEIYILAVMHLKRKPGYWMKRLQNYEEKNNPSL